MTKTKEIEALKAQLAERDNVIAVYRTRNENQANTIADWRNRYNDDIKQIQAGHKVAVEKTVKYYEERLRETHNIAYAWITRLMTRSADMLAEQEAHFLLEIEKARTNTLAQAFDHVVSKLAER